MNKYKEYAKLKAHEAVVKAQLADMAQEILKDIGDEPRQANGYGLFSKVVRKNYKYSDRLLEREKEAKELIKRAKEREERNGAEFEEAVSLRYSPAK